MARVAKRAKMAEMPRMDKMCRLEETVKKCQKNRIAQN